MINYTKVIKIYIIYKKTEEYPIMLLTNPIISSNVIV